jgi:hypothetical protein
MTPGRQPHAPRAKYLIALPDEKLLSAELEKICRQLEARE